MKTITATKTEQREWMINRGDMVPTREHEGRCKYCKKKLSQYNTGESCFSFKCQLKRQKEEDAEEQEKVRQQMKSYKQEKSKYYLRRKDEKSCTNSKGTNTNR